MIPRTASLSFCRCFAAAAGARAERALPNSSTVSTARPAMAHDEAWRNRSGPHSRNPVADARSSRRKGHCRRARRQPRCRPLPTGCPKMTLRRWPSSSRRRSASVPAWTAEDIADSRIDCRRLQASREAGLQRRSAQSLPRRRDRRSPRLGPRRRHLRTARSLRDARLPSTAVRSSRPMAASSSSCRATAGYRSTISGRCRKSAASAPD